MMWSAGPSSPHRHSLGGTRGMGATLTAQTSLTSPPGKAPEPARSGPLRYLLTHPQPPAISCLQISFSADSACFSSSHGSPNSAATLSIRWMSEQPAEGWLWGPLRRAGADRTSPAADSGRHLSLSSSLPPRAFPVISPPSTRAEWAGQSFLPDTLTPTHHSKDGMGTQGNQQSRVIRLAIRSGKAWTPAQATQPL